MADDEGLLTLRELAELAGLSYETVGRYVRRYRALIPTAGDGRRRYPRAAVGVIEAIKRTHAKRQGAHLRRGDTLTRQETLLDSLRRMDALVEKVARELRTMEAKVEATIVEIKEASETDFFPLYLLGTEAEEDTGRAGPFMEPAEFTHCLLNKEDWLVLTARAQGSADEGGAHVGFLVALLAGRSACIHHLVVAPEHRHRGVGTDLLARCFEELRRRGVERVGGFAHGSIRLFLAGEGFREGGTYVWMERKIV